MYPKFSLVERDAWAVESRSSARRDNHPAGIRQSIRQYRPFSAGGANHRKHLCIGVTADPPVVVRADDFPLSFGYGEGCAEKQAWRSGEQTRGVSSSRSRRYDPQVGAARKF